MNDWLQTPLLRALWNRLSRSAFDKCSANDGRARITTDIRLTVALNITSKADFSAV